MGIIHAKTKTWDRASYYALAESGALKPGERVELLEGEILAISPQNPAHAYLITRLNEFFSEAFRGTHFVRIQLPLHLGEFSEPEPDLAIISKAAWTDRSTHPKSADLVIEVADSSLALDRHEKASLYAKFAIQDYWIVNVRERIFEVFRGPGEDPAAFYKFAYTQRVRYAVGEWVEPLCAPGMRVAVEQLLG